ncbi:transposase (plasmid) [Isosphaeraceae bacterium EP7]
MHQDPGALPRRRANKVRGHGSFIGDRPPVVGVTGLGSGKLRLAVVERSDRATLEGFVVSSTRQGSLVCTDEWRVYGHLAEHGRRYATVTHAPGRREWARDDDWDGVREVHDNTLEGIWTGLRSFLMTFRGVSKWSLACYVARFEWSYNLKEVKDDYLRILLGVKLGTGPGS